MNSCSFLGKRNGKCACVRGSIWHECWWLTKRKYNKEHTHIHIGRRTEPENIWSELNRLGNKYWWRCDNHKFYKLDIFRVYVVLWPVQFACSVRLPFCLSVWLPAWMPTVYCLPSKPSKPSIHILLSFQFQN